VTSEISPAAERRTTATTSRASGEPGDRTRRSPSLLAPLLLVLAALLAPSAADAQGRSWHLQSFRSEIRVRADGALEVSEVLRPTFRGSYNGIYRTIPVEYRTPSGFDRDLDLEVRSVTDGAGNALRYETDREGDDLRVKIWVPDATDATRTVDLRYRVESAIRFREDYEELYWNVTGTEWAVPIDSAAATIVLPEGASGVRVRSYTGPFGSRASDAEIERRENRIRVRATRRLEYGEGLTAAVAWDPGLVSRPGFGERLARVLADNWILLLPLLAAGFMFWLWRRRGRDPAVGSIAPRYEPPDGLTPAEVGVVVDDHPHPRDITATMVDLAVRGYLTIESREESKLMGLSTERGYVLHRERPPEEWTELREHERNTMEGLFEGGRESVELSELENEFYEHLSDIRDDIFAELMDRKLYRRRPDQVRSKYLVIAMAVATIILAAGLEWGGLLSASPMAVTVAAFGTGLVFVGFGWHMPARTRAGADMYAQVLGFEEFLERVEEDRFRRMITGPEMFEAFLPYAMALGVEKKWAAAFEDMYRRPPEWYRGSSPSGFHAGILAADMGRLSTDAGTAMTSRPRSSGGSSFSGGGGFSGGGVGGGGGGAF